MNAEFQFDILKEKIERIQTTGCCLSVVVCAASASISLLTMTEVFLGGHII